MVLSHHAARDFITDYVKNWSSSYMFYTKMHKDLGSSLVYKIIWSKPIPGKPIPDYVAVVMLTLIDREDGPGVTYQLENQSTIHNGEMPFQEVWLDNVIAEKRAVRESLKLLDVGTLPDPRSFVPGEYMAEAEAEKHANAEEAPIDEEEVQESAQELEQLLIEIFKQADKDGSGSLDHKEFRKVMDTAKIGLNRNDVNILLAEADTNADGQVEYSEFVPIAVEIIQNIRLRQKFQEEQAQLADAAEQAALETVRMTREELQDYMVAAFKEFDTDESGALSRTEFKACLQSIKVGNTRLTRKEMNLVLAQADSDNDGTVSYSEFVPLMFDYLVDAIKAGFMSRDFSDLEMYLVGLFSAEDQQGAGTLPRATMKSVLMHADLLNLSRIEVQTLLAEATADANHNIDYTAWIDKAVPLLVSMKDPKLMAVRASAIKRAEYTPVELLKGFDEESVNKMLQEVFREHDADGNGVLSWKEFSVCLQNTNLGFSAQEINALLTGADMDADGNVNLQEFCALAYDVLLHMAREKKLMAEAAS